MDEPGPLSGCKRTLSHTAVGPGPPSRTPSTTTGKERRGREQLPSATPGEEGKDLSRTVTVARQGRTD